MGSVSNHLEVAKDDKISGSRLSKFPLWRRATALDGRSIADLGLGQLIGRITQNSEC